MRERVAVINQVVVALKVHRHCECRLSFLVRMLACLFGCLCLPGSLVVCLSVCLSVFVCVLMFVVEYVCVSLYV